MIEVLHLRLLRGIVDLWRSGQVNCHREWLKGKGVSGFDEAGHELDIAGGVVGGEVGEGGSKSG